jgi:hypothetical protein
MIMPANQQTPGGYLAVTLQSSSDGELVEVFDAAGQPVTNR